MEFGDVIEKRRSTRRFVDRKIDRDVIGRILGSAFRAPVAKNVHSTRFVVVQDRETLERISQMRDYGSQFLSSAAAVIVVAGVTTQTDCWRENCTIAASYIQLAAVDEGLASCWAHCFGRRREMDNPVSQTANDFLHSFLPLEESCEVECVIGLGYADYTPKPLPEYDFGKDVVWYGEKE